MLARPSFPTECPLVNIQFGEQMLAVKRIETAVYAVQAVLSILLLGALCCIVLVQVIFRYVLDDPLFWSEEISRFMFIWLSFVGFGVAVHRRQEMRVAFFFDRASPVQRKWLSALSLLLMLATCALLTFHGCQLALQSFDVLSVALELPWTWIFLAVPVGFALIFVQYALRLYEVVSTPAGVLP